MPRISLATSRSVGIEVRVQGRFYKLTARPNRARVASYRGRG